MAQARVIATGRIGKVLISDLDDALLSYKLSFDDGKDPSADWFSKLAVTVIEESLDEGKTPEESLAASVRPGRLFYCRFLVRGMVKVTEAIVVEIGTCQIVVACPEGCALNAAGDWASSPELGACQIVHCACAEPGTRCPVVFYSVDPAALLTEMLPEAIDFRLSGMPSAENLVQLFRSEANSDSLHIQALPNGSLTSSNLFYEVRIAKLHSLLVHNSVVMIPDFLTRKECHELIDSADNSLSEERACQKLRLPVYRLDQRAQTLSTLIVDKVLSFLEQQLPQVAERLFGRSSKLKNMSFVYAPGEPAVNRYHNGGKFSPHTDKEAVTVNVVLSDLGAFGGGGTMFWPEETTDNTLFRSRTGGVLLRPLPGTAVLFNGSVMHAGREASSGIRHLYVASFSLYE